MKLVIDRKRWLRGNPDESCLLTLDGRMCCLGFFGLVCGFAPEQLLGRGGPTNVVVDEVIWPEWLFCGLIRKPYPPYSDDGIKLMRENDKVDIPSEERETRIAEIFARHGVEVEFRDSPEGT
jgi:hypothetical protein